MNTGDVKRLYTGKWTTAVWFGDQLSAIPTFEEVAVHACLGDS